MIYCPVYDIDICDAVKGDVYKILVGADVRIILILPVVFIQAAYEPFFEMAVLLLEVNDGPVIQVVLLLEV